MSRSDPPVAHPLRDAVTVILLRAAAPGGIEVLLLERHGDSPFAPGALVFPGGKIDPEDGRLDPARWRCTDLGIWRERLGASNEETAVAMLVAAVRETFEEAGVLLAVREDGRSLAEAPLPAQETATVRAAMAARDRAHDWRPWLEDEGLVLDLDALAMWSWWVTPQGLPRRYDTRFLVAAMPAGQDAAPDGVELTAMRWVRPEDALAAHGRAEARVMYPTRCTLEQLSAHTDPASACAAAGRGDVDLRRIEPRLRKVGDEPMVEHPDGGDAVPG
ncbi:MAG: hypothetical protein WD638_02425 [Nitriliruptoraceae bacterium]